jgi:hypothetical protein
MGAFWGQIEATHFFAVGALSVFLAAVLLQLLSRSSLASAHQ